MIMKDPEFKGISSKPHIINQDELNDLVSYLNLSNFQAELFASKLIVWNLFGRGTKISMYCQRQQDLHHLFTSEGDLVYGTDVDLLLNMLGHSHDPFLKLCFLILKMRNSQFFLFSLPILKFDNIKNFLPYLYYEHYSLHIWGDFKLKHFY